MGRLALCALLGCSLACAGGGGGGGSVGITTDAGTPAGNDAGSVDAGPDGGNDAGIDAGPPGGGDWRQYRHDGRGGSENAGVFAASAAGDLAELWKAPVQL